MLDITKLEAGEVPVHARSYDLWKTVNDVVFSDEQRIEDGKIDIQGLGGRRWRSTPTRILCTRSSTTSSTTPSSSHPRAGPSPSRPKKARTARWWRSAIENTGAGIAAEALPFVFERFYKEDRSRGMNTRGSGLGLHICKILRQPFGAGRSTPKARPASGAALSLRCPPGVETDTAGKPGRGASPGPVLCARRSFRKIDVPVGFRRHRPHPRRRFHRPGSPESTPKTAFEKRYKKHR